VPEGGELMTRVMVAGSMVIVTGLVFELAGELESVAFTVTVTTPEAVGVPVIEQFAFSVSPLGIVPPARVQVYGAVPPLTPMLPA
jgi:hypothetical protein